MAKHIKHRILDLTIYTVVLHTVIALIRFMF